MSDYTHRIHLTDEDFTLWLSQQNPIVRLTNDEYNHDGELTQTRNLLARYIQQRFGITNNYQVWLGLDLDNLTFSCHPDGPSGTLSINLGRLGVWEDDLHDGSSKITARTIQVPDRYPTWAEEWNQNIGGAALVWLAITHPAHVFDFDLFEQRFPTTLPT